MYSATYPNGAMTTPAQQPQPYWQPAPAAAAWPHPLAMPATPGPVMPNTAWGFPQQTPPMPMQHAASHPAYAPVPPTFVVMQAPAYGPAYAYQPAPMQAYPYYAPPPAMASQMPAPQPLTQPVTTDMVTDECVSAIEQVRSQLRAFAGTLNALKASRAA